MSVLKPAPASTPTATKPAPGAISAVKVAIDVIQSVQGLEETIIEEGWLPASWVARNGPTIRDRRDGMVLLHRGWQSVLLTTTGRSGDLTDLRAALIELAAAAVKVAADVDGYRQAKAAMAAELDCTSCGLIPPTSAPGTRDVDTDEDDED